MELLANVLLNAQIMLLTFMQMGQFVDNAMQPALLVMEEMPMNAILVLEAI